MKLEMIVINEMNCQNISNMVPGENTNKIIGPD